MSRVVKKADERKEELVNVATQLFMEKGYENTSVKDIYTKANGSFGMFYHHFKSKEEVLEEVNKRMTTKVYSEIKEIVLDTSLTGIEKLRKIITASIVSSKQCAIDNNWPSFQKNPQLLAFYIRDTLAIAPELIMRIIEDGMKDGTIQTTQPLEFSQMILLFFNIWINPWVCAWTPDELKNIFMFIKDLFETIGIPVFTEEMLDAINELCTIMRENPRQ